MARYIFIMNIRYHLEKGKGASSRNPSRKLRMKRRFVIGLIIAAAFATLLAGCSIEWTSAEVWTLDYQWDSSSQASAKWTLYGNGTDNSSTFVDNHGGTGYWSVNGSLFQLTYNNSAYFSTGTVYTGTVYSSSYMAGSMLWGTNTGNWSAHK